MLKRKERILDIVQKVKENTITMVTFCDLNYLIHSGRVSHLKSIIASLLNIKPIIGMNEVDRRYVGQEITSKTCSELMVKKAHEHFDDQKTACSIHARHQLTRHGFAVIPSILILNAEEDPQVPVTLVLGTCWPTVIGLAASPKSIFDNLDK